MNVPINPSRPASLPPTDDWWPVGVSKPPSNLPETDGEPLESNWHRDAMNLLVEVIRFLFLKRTDFFVGGNMFIYFSWEMVRNRDFRGPDVFLVKGVDGTRDRRYWAIWEENGRYPNLIIELLSPTTADVDRTTKKDVYEQTFRTPEYFLYDRETEQLEGWRLNGQLRYQPIAANERGWLWSEQLGAWLGTWRGLFQGYLFETVWLRCYTTTGELIPLFAEHEAAGARQAKADAEKEKERAEKEKERAEKEKERAEKEKERAEKIEGELARFKAFFAEKGLPPPTE